jgi:hypothetical protein
MYLNKGLITSAHKLITAIILNLTLCYLKVAKLAMQIPEGGTLDPEAFVIAFPLTF